MAASGYDKIVYSAMGDRWFYFDSFPDAENKFDMSNPRVAYLKQRLEKYIASDVCPERIDKPPVRPYDQPKYSFYPQWDDHINTFAEEYARMPEGYPIKLGGKHTDY